MCLTISALVFSQLVRPKVGKWALRFPENGVPSNETQKRILEGERRGSVAFTGSKIFSKISERVRIFLVWLPFGEGSLRSKSGSSHIFFYRLLGVFFSFFKIGTLVFSKVCLGPEKICCEVTDSRAFGRKFNIALWMSTISCCELDVLRYYSYRVWG